MKRIALLFIFCQLLFSCSQSDDNNGTNPEDSAENYQVFFEDSKLMLSPSESHQGLDLEVTFGNKLVFKFLNFEDPLPDFVDDEQTTIVYFEMDPDVTEFKIEAKDFDEANAVIGVGASIRIIEKITEGAIIGTKISENEWKIDLDVSSKNEEIDIEINASTSANFTKSTFEGIWMPIYTY